VGIEYTAHTDLGALFHEYAFCAGVPDMGGQRLTHTTGGEQIEIGIQLGTVEAENVPGMLQVAQGFVEGLYLAGNGYVGKIIRSLRRGRQSGCDQARTGPDTLARI
jgi:hypothetical protein